MLDLVIRGGKLSLRIRSERWTSRIQGEKIVALGRPGTLAADANRVIDAQERSLYPAGSSPMPILEFQCLQRGPAKQT